MIRSFYLSKLTNDQSIIFLNEADKQTIFDTKIKEKVDYKLKTITF